MIQEYLNEQFIQTTDDANFDKLKKTCTEVVKKIGKDKAKILAYALVAFDPEIHADNKEVVEVKGLIVENWQTFHSNSKDTALTIIRAIMLDALQSVAKETNIAAIIWFAVRNAFQHFKLGREKDILTKFLVGLGNAVETKASESWDFSPHHLLELPKVTPAAIDENDFAGGFTQATSNAAINKAFKKQVVEIKESQKEFASLIGLMQMRNQLLWWKEAGYSPSLKASHKDVKDGFLQVLLAYDYSQFIPDMYPVSADYFLLEAHVGLSTKAEDKIKISEFLEMVAEHRAELSNLLPTFIQEDGRISFANFVKGFVQGKYQGTDFKTYVGIADSTELTLGNITLWLFHDLHSIKLTTSK